VLYQNRQTSQQPFVDADPPPLTTTNASKKEAKVVMQNIFFSTPEEAIAYQEKMKGMQPNQAPRGEGMPGADPNGAVPGDMGGLQPSTSYEQMEKEKQQETKDLGKRIQEEVKNSIDSVLAQKVAAMFDDSDKALVEAMVNKGRTWGEIKKFYTDMKYDEDSVVAFLDEFQRGAEAPMGEPVAPKPELPHDKMEAPKPPLETVTPQTHDKLVEEVQNPTISPAPADMLYSEIARMDGEIVKRADDFLDMPPVTPGGGADTGPFPSEGIPPATEQPTDPEPLVQTSPDLPKPGDRVYVMGDPATGQQGFEGQMASTFTQKGDTYATIFNDAGEELSVPMHLVQPAGSSNIQPVPPALASKSGPDTDQPEQETKSPAEMMDDEYKAVVSWFDAKLKKISTLTKEAGLEDVIWDTLMDHAHLLRRVTTQEEQVDVIHELGSAIMQALNSAGLKDWKGPAAEPSDMPQGLASLEPKVEKKAATMHKCPGCGDSWECDPRECQESESMQCPKCMTASKKTAAPGEENVFMAPGVTPVQDAPPEVPTQFKQHKVAPPHTDREKAVPATPEIEESFKQYQVAAQNLDTIKSLIGQATLKFNEEKKRLEQQGGRLENEAQLKMAIEKLAKLVEAVESKTVQVGDDMLRLVQEQKEAPVRWDAKEKLDHIYKKFPETEKYIENALKGAQRLATTETIRELIMFPRKMSKLDRQANLLDTLNDIYQNMSMALKNLMPAKAEVAPGPPLQQAPTADLDSKKKLTAEPGGYQPQFGNTPGRWKEWIVLPTQSWLNPKAPESNEYFNADCSYVICERGGRYVAISGYGSGYATGGEQIELRHDQTGQRLGAVKVVGEFTPETLKQQALPKMPLYVFK